MEEFVSKRDINRARRRACIVDVATRAFFNHGYAATSMSAIAEEIGGSKATLWAQFPSKDELFGAVVDEQVRQFSADIEDVLRDQQFSMASLRRFLERFLDCLMKDSSIRLFRLVMGEGERFPELTRLFWERGPARMFEGVCAFYATAFEAGESRRLAQLTIAAVTGFRSQILMAPPQTVETETALLVDSLIAHLQFPDCPDAACRPSPADGQA